MSLQPNRLESPRILATVPLAADTVTSLLTLIDTFVKTSAVARALFCDADVANTAARVAAQTGKLNGYTVFQIDTSAFYELTNGEAANADANWTLVTTSQMNRISNFMNALSGFVITDSSLANVGAGTTYVMNAWVPSITPTSASMISYGVPLTSAERTFSGYAKQHYLYSLAGTNIRLDIRFATGVL